jgi:hypothetical protein
MRRPWPALGSSAIGNRMIINVKDIITVDRLAVQV